MRGRSKARGEARRFGEGAAILIGDFAFVYSDILFASAPPRRVPVFDELRLELCVGQYLDLAGMANGPRARERADVIERYKSGKYTVERPLHLGAALADRFDALADGLSAFGLPLGHTFQMRDDLLGVFGDPSLTGKPVGDDLREGKLTPLIASAVTNVGRTGSAVDLALLDRLGTADLTDDEIAAVQDLLVESGAVADVEAAIDAQLTEALAALADVADRDARRASRSKRSRRSPPGAISESARDHARSVVRAGQGAVPGVRHVVLRGHVRAAEGQAPSRAGALRLLPPRRRRRRARCPARR